MEDATSPSSTVEERRSAPRQSPRKKTGFSPCGRPHQTQEAATSVRPQPTNEIEWSSPRKGSAIATNPRTTVEERRFQRTSSPRKRNRASAPVDGSSEGLLPAKPPRTGARRSSPESLEATRSGRTRPQSRLKPSKNAIEPATTALTRRESNHLKPAQHRGRAAPQRRVQRYYKEDGL